MPKYITVFFKRTLLFDSFVSLLVRKKYVFCRSVDFCLLRLDKQLKGQVLFMKTVHSIICGQSINEDEREFYGWHFPSCNKNQSISNMNTHNKREVKIQNKEDVEKTKWVTVYDKKNGLHLKKLRFILWNWKNVILHELFSNKKITIYSYTSWNELEPLEIWVIYQQYIKITWLHVMQTKKNWCSLTEMSLLPNITILVYISLSSLWHSPNLTLLMVQLNQLITQSSVRGWKYEMKLSWR